jgi:HK97 gp10 family phage protein
MAKVEIKGFAEAVKMLEHLDDKLQRRVLLRVMRNAAKPVISSAKSFVNSRSKRVAKSIKAFEPKDKTNPVLFVGPKFSKNREADPWFAHFIEFGAKGEGRFVRKQSSWRNTQDDRFKIFRFINAKRKGKQRYRADQTAYPFMEPAVNQNIKQVSDLFVNDIDNLIQNEVAKLK